MYPWSKSVFRMSFVELGSWNCLSAYTCRPNVFLSSLVRYHWQKLHCGPSTLNNIAKFASQTNPRPFNWWQSSYWYVCTEPVLSVSESCASKYHKRKSKQTVIWDAIQASLHQRAFATCASTCWAQLAIKGRPPSTNVRYSRSSDFSAKISLTCLKATKVKLTGTKFRFS